MSSNLRSAILEVSKSNDYNKLELLISQGANVNFNEADMVFPLKDTPLTVAACHGTLPICKILVEHGADVTIANELGMRPYHCALESGDEEMAIYFKSLEPAAFHIQQNKLIELKNFDLSESLLNFLQAGTKRFDLGNNHEFEFIEFFSLTDTILMVIEGEEYLRISKRTGDQGHIMFVWNPKGRCISYYDYEHGEIGNIAAFDDFIDNLAGYMTRVLDGEFSV